MIKTKVEVEENLLYLHFAQCRLKFNISSSSQPSTDAPDTGDHVGEEEMKDEDGSMYYLPVALGLVTLAGLALVMWGLLHRYVCEM